MQSDRPTDTTDTEEIIGTTTAQITTIPDDDGIEIDIPDEITDALGLTPGDDVTVSTILNDDGTVDIQLDFPGIDDLTPEQRQTLHEHLNNPE